MKRMVCFVMAVMLAALSLTACGTTGGGKVDSKPGVVPVQRLRRRERPSTA